MNLREHLATWSESAFEWDTYIDLADQFSDLTDDAERIVLGARIADLLESCAAKTERSTLAGLQTAYSPETLRANAAEYRAGRDPHADLSEAS